jgi:hypothetical protein
MENSEVKPNVVEEKVETQVTEDVAPVVETKVEEKVEKKSLFDRAWERLTKPKATEEGTEVKEEVVKPVVEEKVNSEDTIEIEDELYQAAKAHGWDDEKIAKYYQEDKSVLEALAKSAVKPAVKVEEVVEDKGLEKFEMTDETLGALKDQYGEEVIDKVVKPLMAKLNQTIDIVNEQSTHTKQVATEVSKQAMTQQVQAFQKEMDKLGKTYEIFGQWENVPLEADGKVSANNPVLKVRDEVWQAARMFQKNGKDWSTAVEDAVSLYKGRHLETLTQSQIIKDLEKRKVKFMPRPTSKKVEAAPLSGDARKIAVINKGLKVIGKE